MKVSGALLTKALLVVSVAGRPYQIKRDVITEVTFTTVTVANVVVYVDEQGIPYQTTTVDQITSLPSAFATSVVAAPVLTSASVTTQGAASVTKGDPPVDQVTAEVPVTNNPEATAISQPTQDVVAPAAPASSPVQTPELAPAPVPPVQSSPSPESPPHAPEGPPAPQSAPSASPQAQVNEDSFPLGVTYDPFKPGGCKTEEEVAAEWDKMKDFGIVRIYGMGCDIIPRAFKLATKYNQKLMAGIYKTNDQSSENIDTVVRALADAVKEYAGGNWGIVSLVSVENEKINDRTMTASDAIDYIRQAKDALGAVGYHGPVGAVETAPAVIDNPEVCKRSDLTMVNIHAFFDENTKAADAGEFVRREVERVKEACGGQRVIVTESGWPHDGQSHGQAVASKEDQAAALASIRQNFDRDLFIHNAFDCTWKADSAATFNAERFWGFL
ncbi:glycoside hydrolase family 17 protein [Aaosphaeria arxii CBS 175.79]|uniref:Glycoside hydrolase family 17 protein n=1 Tax=Aaosphaeria arxii CBS 175.79 TaxID=1450172 RepID=A0A6A5XFT4_9PLEO|nr:glycoside hydrolase family 17 protein [Aaosphaeria arxii CBS 175.79]KAF2011790.1 glycoside hydrolase family 17 protein [Aaosphaeria arxii CBS 175.79]